MKRPPVADRCAAPAARVRPLGQRERSRLTGALKALADPTRLEIFRTIAAREGSVCVCEITAGFAVSQPTISYHLRVLRKAGLVTVSRRGVWAHYEARPGVMDAVGDLLGALPVTHRRLSMKGAP